MAEYVRKHSPAMRSYWRRMRRAAEKLGITVKEARVLYRTVMSGIRRDTKAVRRAFGGAGRG